MTTALMIVDVQQGMFALPSPLHRGEEVVRRLDEVATASGRRHSPRKASSSTAPGLTGTPASSSRAAWPLTWPLKSSSRKAGPKKSWIMRSHSGLGVPIIEWQKASGSSTPMIAAPAM